jgi:CRP/FNR family cyclic AMP-dependent transcriptional regulator
VLALQRVRMFSELDPEDLERVAAATREIRYEPGEVVFAEGQTGDEMLLIVGGEVEVTTSSAGARRHIETYGPGEPVGELALLTGGPRSADVHAGEEGAHGLLLTGSDLSSVLAERPEVALRMLGTLAERLARQTPAPRSGSLPQ